MTPKLQTGNRVDGPPLPRTFSVVALHDSRLVAVFYAQVTCRHHHPAHPRADNRETRCSLEHVSHLYLTARAVHKAVHRDRPASDPLRCRGGGRVAGRVTKPKYWRQPHTRASHAHKVADPPYLPCAPDTRDVRQYRWQLNRVVMTRPRAVPMSSASGTSRCGASQRKVA